MVLHLIGLGLNDEKDISVKALEAIKKCSEIYLETYTSILSCSIEDLEKFYGKKIIPVHREIVESEFEQKILKNAKENDIALLVVGDPFGATTHVDLRIRALKAKIEVEVYHNASVLTAIGIIGLELYKYGKVTSIPFLNENITTPIKVFEMNKKNGLHTLFLLDLHPKENKFMTINEAITYLFSKGVKDTLAIGCAGLGAKKPQIKAAKLSELEKHKFDIYPQCMIIPGDLHFMEEEMLEIWQ